MNHDILALQKQYQDINMDILKFIDNIRTHCGNNIEQNEGIYQLFASGYCYYFAKMLEDAFPGGTVVWCAPFGHIAYQYENYVYDIHYLCESETDLFIPVSELGDSLYDFRRIPGKSYNVSKEEIDRIIERHKQSKKTDKKS